MPIISFIGVLPLTLTAASEAGNDYPNREPNSSYSFIPLTYIAADWPGQMAAAMIQPAD